MSEADALARRLVANWIESHPSYLTASAYAPPQV